MEPKFALQYSYQPATGPSLEPLLLIRQYRISEMQQRSGIFTVTVRHIEAVSSN